MSQISLGCFLFLELRKKADNRKLTRDKHRPGARGSDAKRNARRAKEKTGRAFLF